MVVEFLSKNSGVAWSTIIATPDDDSQYLSRIEPNKEEIIKNLYKGSENF